MDKTPKSPRSPQEIAASVKKWQQSSARERLEEAARLTLEAFGLKKAPRIDKTRGGIIKYKPDDPDR